MEQVLSPELSQPITSTPSSSPSSSLPSDQIDPTFANSTLDLISAPLSPTILDISNEFFAPASNLLTPTPPISKPGVFVPTGAWYDGWESRRHNPLPYDHVTIRLGVAAGRVRGVEIDTAFFTGNHAPEISVEGCYETGEGADERVVKDGYKGWMAVLGRRACEPNRRHAWVVGLEQPGKAEAEAGAEELATYSDQPITHTRLRMYPDGGIARFRLYGTAEPVWPTRDPYAPPGAPPAPAAAIELSAARNGGLATAVSDQHYGRAANLLLPGRGIDMGDGWETKRSRGAGHVDWAVVRLGARGRVERVVVDTMHFRGNFPREVRVALGEFLVEGEEVGRMDVSGDEDGKEEEEDGWVEVVRCKEMKADTEFEFLEGRGLEKAAGRAWTHARLTMVPDGGVKRFRVFGTRV